MIFDTDQAIMNEVMKLVTEKLRNKLEITHVLTRFEHLTFL